MVCQGVQPSLGALSLTSSTYHTTGVYMRLMVPTLLRRWRLAATAIAIVLIGGSVLTRAESDRDDKRAPRSGDIEHIMVIDLENENFNATFGAASPAVYLNHVLLDRGQLVVNYFATSHVSLGNYLSQVSGQAPTADINNDCLDLRSLSGPALVGGFTNVSPGTDAANQAAFPGQVVGNGCVFPAPEPGVRGARTIGDQLDAFYRREQHEHAEAPFRLAGSQKERDDDGDDSRDRRLNWRGYAEDMGNNLVRDYGTIDPTGGATCAHPPIDGTDFTNSASVTDQYATRHNPFVYFHSVIDNQARCDEHVVPMGRVRVGAGGARDKFSGHLYEDLRHVETTPKFMFVTPNLCNDGHGATCIDPNVEGTTSATGQNIGGLVAADLWLKHWMPMILDSPAYRNGTLLVVLTFDESGFTDSRACPSTNQALCGSPIGPNVTNPGFSPILGLFKLQVPPTTNYVYAGGGQVGAVLFNARYIKPGSVNTVGFYNHYSALRSYEDLLGLTSGGDDGRGHLGYAAVPGLATFGVDVFNRRTP